MFLFWRWVIEWVFLERFVFLYIFDRFIYKKIKFLGIRWENIILVRFVEIKKFWLAFFLEEMLVKIFSFDEFSWYV